MCRTRHLKQYTDGAATEIIRHYLMDRARSKGLNDSLGATDCQTVLADLLKVKRSLEAVRRRGGVVVVSEGESFLTAYRFDSFNSRYLAPETHAARLSSSEKHFLSERGVQWL